MAETDAGNMIGFPATENLHFSVLGPVRCRHGSVELSLGPPQQRAMLAVLMTSAPQPVLVHELIDVLWGEQPPANAVNILYRYVGLLRRTLEPHLSSRSPGRWLLRDSGGYRLDAGPENLDLLEFRRLVAQAGLEADDNTKVTLLRDALALWQGPCAAGLAPVYRHHPQFTDVDRAHTAAVRELADAADRAGTPQVALAVVTEACRAYPLDESLQAKLIRLLAQVGRQAEALAVYDQVRRQLAEQLGVDPGAALREAHAAVLSGQGALGRTPSARAAHESGRRGTWPPAQLPADLAKFAGRQEALGLLASSWPDQADATGVVIHLITGRGGVGKTTLAMHYAHQVAPGFPDGQLFVNLRGFDPTARPVPPADALHGFLSALRVAPQAIPADLDERAALFRSLVAGTRTLIVLDNARDAEQVRPLLPGTSGCMVIVTSRDRLTGLVVTESALPISLDVLADDEARELLIERIGRHRAAQDPAAVDSLVQHCDGLPLTLSLAAARVATHPELTLAMIAGEVRHSLGRLDAFTSTDALTDLRMVLAGSRRNISPAAATMLPLLALHPGPDLTVLIAASAAGLAEEVTQDLLTELESAHLIAHRGADRYVIHDLVRAFAVELLANEVPDEERRRATRRCLDHFLISAHTAAQHLHPHRDPIPLLDCESGVTSAPIVDVESAADWLYIERWGLRAAVILAAETGEDERTWQLAWTLEHELYRQAEWHDWVTTQQMALASARRAGNQSEQVHSLRSLATAHCLLGKFAAANSLMNESRLLGTQLGDRLATAHTDRSYTLLMERQGDNAAALSRAWLALEGYRAVGHRMGEAYALNAAGWYLTLLGDYGQAIMNCETALRIFEATGNRAAAGATLDSLGLAYHNLGRYHQAIELYERGATAFREVRDGPNRADTLIRLGESLLAAGDSAGTQRCWREALSILRTLGHPDAPRVAKMLKRASVTAGSEV